MNNVPEAYAANLKKEFSESPRYCGYDADEDQGYFLEWLIGRLYAVEKSQQAEEAARKRRG